MMDHTESIHPKVQRLLPTVPPELVVHEGDEPCPYLEGRIARRPLRMPTRHLTRAEFDARLDRGDRRTGFFLYTQECPACRACEPLRIDVSAFVPTRTHRRTLARGRRELTIERGPFEADSRRVALYLAHQSGRGLAKPNAPQLDEHGYEAFLVDTCTDGFEMRYFREGELVAVAITDRSSKALSAVYTYYDPALASLSIGTYSILEQIALAKELGLPWLYLGLAIEESAHMRYKLAFLPHERRIDGTWKRFERDGAE
jgi:arginyl-tRNA--protein-N-Asp/Glu arginylyltransferase